MYGKKLSDEARTKISLSLLGKTGALSRHWKGGITPINQRERATLAYKNWRKAVFIRDNYTCVWCNRLGGKLNADHIKPFALYLELRFDVSNGRTLCVECHKKTETYCGRVNQRMPYALS